MKLSPEAILLRWVNHQLERAGVPRRINNLTNDIVDSEAYTHLLYQIAPLELGVTKEALMESDPINRAEIMLQQADKLGCRSFVSPKDVVEGIYKLNLAFVANLFNNHPGLDSSNIDLEDYANVEESREEKTYRNWMNSLGVSPYVNNLSSDLADGLVIFQLYEIINPGNNDALFSNEISLVILISLIVFLFCFLLLLLRLCQVESSDAQVLAHEEVHGKIGELQLRRTIRSPTKVFVSGHRRPRSE